jgi:hypothetical protein
MKKLLLFAAAVLSTACLLSLSAKAGGPTECDIDPDNCGLPSVSCVASVGEVADGYVQFIIKDASGEFNGYASVSLSVENIYGELPNAGYQFCSATERVYGDDGFEQYSCSEITLQIKRRTYHYSCP